MDWINDFEHTPEDVKYKGEKDQYKSEKVVINRQVKIVWTKYEWRYRHDGDALTRFGNQSRNHSKRATRAEIIASFDSTPDEPAGAYC